MGKLETCGCHPHLDHKTNTWKWKGCNHNVEFGHNFARKFLDYKEKANDLHSHTNLHNNRAGRLVSRDRKFAEPRREHLVLTFVSSCCLDSKKFF